MPHHSPAPPICFHLFSILLMYHWGLLPSLASKEKQFWLVCLPISLQCVHHCFFILSLDHLVVLLLDLFSCFPLLIASKISLLCFINSSIFFCWSWRRFINIAFCSVAGWMHSLHYLFSCVVFILMAWRYMLSSASVTLFMLSVDCPFASLSCLLAIYAASKKTWHCYEE